MSFVETEERTALRAAVRKLGDSYGHDYFVAQARSGQHCAELWCEAAELGYVGVNLPEEYGGGGAGMYELSVVLEELGSAGCPLLMLVVSSAICGTVITKFGTEDQKQRWLPGISDGSIRMAFAITEPDAGSNSHNLATIARRDGDEWLLSGRKVFISGVDAAAAVLIVGRTEDAKAGRLKPALFIVPTDAPGLESHKIEMEIVAAESQYGLFLDNVRVPADALIGSVDAGLPQLFAGLNPERIMASAYGIGTARHALDKATAYARQRRVWATPIGAHQGVAHPLAQRKIEIELARLMMQKAAHLYDAGADTASGEAANMAKYASAEACARTVDAAIHTLGGNGLTTEYGVATMLGTSRLTRLAPVSREMILNFVAQHGLGMPKSY